jgi:hypothetical protein
MNQQRGWLPLNHHLTSRHLLCAASFAIEFVLFEHPLLVSELTDALVQGVAFLNVERKGHERLLSFITTLALETASSANQVAFEDLADKADLLWRRSYLLVDSV